MPRSTVTQTPFHAPRPDTNARNLDALEEVAAEHRALGHDVRALRLDQGDEASIAGSSSGEA